LRLVEQANFGAAEMSEAFSFDYAAPGAEGEPSAADITSLVSLYASPSASKMIPSPGHFSPGTNDGKPKIVAMPMLGWGSPAPVASPPQGFEPPVTQTLQMALSPGRGLPAPPTLERVQNKQIVAMEKHPTQQALQDG